MRFSPGGLNLTSHRLRAASDRWPHDVLNITRRSCNHPNVTVQFLGTQDRVKPVGYIRVTARPPYDHRIVTLRYYEVLAALRLLTGDITAFLRWLTGFLSTLRYLILWTVWLPCGRRNIFHLHHYNCNQQNSKIMKKSHLHTVEPRTVRWPRRFH